MADGYIQLYKVETYANIQNMYNRYLLVFRVFNKYIYWKYIIINYNFGGPLMFFYILQKYLQSNNFIAKLYL
jgi:hypothetical protein